MKLSIASADDLFIRRKCGACRRLVLPGQAVFSHFSELREWGNAWVLLHLPCVQAGGESVAHVISSMSLDMDPRVVAFHALREQIIRTKEAFPHAAA